MLRQKLAIKAWQIWRTLQVAQQITSDENGLGSKTHSQDMHAWLLFLSRAEIGTLYAARKFDTIKSTCEGPGEGQCMMIRQWKIFPIAFSVLSNRLTLLALCLNFLLWFWYGMHNVICVIPVQCLFARAKPVNSGWQTVFLYKVCVCVCVYVCVCVCVHIVHNVSCYYQLLLPVHILNTLLCECNYTESGHREENRQEAILSHLTCLSMCAIHSLI